MIRDDIQAALTAKLAGAPALGATVLFDMGADGSLFLDGRSDPPAVHDGGAAPDTTIKVSAADLQDMLAGGLDPMDAYATGRLEVDGDMGPAIQLGSLLA